MVKKSPAAPQFFELVNWKKAQPRMKGKDNPWMKLYTSLLDNDQFAGMDDSGRVLIVCLWLYAARSGQHVFPADPAWIRRKIPLLTGDPDLGPLLDARDIYGNPAPFIAYCEPPKPKKARARKAAQGDAKKQTEESRGEESRIEQTKAASRGEHIGRSGKSRREKKKKTAAQQSQPQSPIEHSNPTPADPTKSDAGGTEAATQPDGPLASVKATQPDRRPQRPLSEAVYDKHDLQFGRRIFLALGLPGDPDNGAIDEITSFASTWHKIRRRFGNKAPPTACDQLGMRLLTEARRIANRRGARNKGAVWNDTAMKIAASDKWAN
jgi:hypothetical protein